MQDLVNQVLAIFVTSSVAALIKMYSDLSVMKKDLNHAFVKLRDLETTNGKVQDTALGAPACRYNQGA